MIGFGYGQGLIPKIQTKIFIKRHKIFIFLRLGKIFINRPAAAYNFLGRNSLQREEWISVGQDAGFDGRLFFCQT